MRSAVTLLAAACLGACAQNPVAQQATVDTRYDPIRGDTMVAVTFAPSTASPDGPQVNGLRTMVETGRRAQRDEFVVVSDGTGGPMQQARAQAVHRRRYQSAPWRSQPLDGEPSTFPRCSTNEAGATLDRGPVAVHGRPWNRCR